MWQNLNVKSKNFKKSKYVEQQTATFKIAEEKLFQYSRTTVSSSSSGSVEVWQETIGPGAAERDLCICTPTGSGKTLAYALPIVQMLSTRTLQRLRALVVLPTRDLAIQVKAVFDAIAPAVGLSVGLSIGQNPVAADAAQIVRHPRNFLGMFGESEDMDKNSIMSVDVLVATPGKLMDHISGTKGFTLEYLRYLVVDETDRLLREAYQDWLPNVLSATKSNGHRDIRTSLGSITTLRRAGVERGFKDKTYPRVMKMILSATLTRDPSKLAQLALHQPLFLSLSSAKKRYILPEQLENYIVTCESKLKPLYLLALLQCLQGEQTVVFTSSVVSTHRLSTLLNCFEGLSFRITEFSREYHQSLRSKVLNSFREGNVQVLVASDVFTRGMDVEGVMNVVNYDMPKFTKTYVHRAGRTARAGRSGRCFTLLLREEIKRFNKLLSKADNNNYSTYKLPEKSIEELHPFYFAALGKLKEIVESETTGRDYSSHLIASKAEEWINNVDDRTM
ncbi:DEAD-box ATP-dependent RNA helicase 1 isoform X2 [Cryptomeria japonica]|uniref:DEAD-box ATP-dependent RNA helicase 1 isoform X2 n=1 Tax=Cryptomeria japonica TaxID=3369 RepID=UPI0027DA067D|nr:DEAD-box ATP-dependent RNA helicase 1 isoform X2 [Cryptomeria japonica]